MKPIPVSWWEDIFGEIVLTRQTLVIVCHSHGSVNKQCLNICPDKVITFFSGERKFQNGLKGPVRHATDLDQTVRKKAPAFL